MQDEGFVQMTPGVHLASESDGGDQRYVSPATAVRERGADLVIVGRGVTRAQDMAAAVTRYKDEAWAALQEKYHL